MTTIIDTDDRRTAKALEILATSGQWLKVRGRDGRKRYGIPSQRDANHYYFTDTRSCTCPDRTYSTVPACKHMLAVQLLVASVRFHMGGK